MNVIYKILLSFVSLNIFGTYEAKSQVIDYQLECYEVVNYMFYNFLEKSLDSLSLNPFVIGLYGFDKAEEQPKSHQSDITEIQHYFEMHWYYDSINKNSNLIFFIWVTKIERY